MSTPLDIDRLVDEQKVDRFNVLVVGLGFLAMLADGYEISALSFAGPELLRLWGIEASDLSMVLTASLFGIFMGAPILGYVGDTWGRRRAILISSVICGVSTLAMAAAGNLEQMFVFRVMAGIGMGGLMPNTIALTSELSPRRYRAMMVVLMFVGITIGAAIPSLIAANLISQYGWQILFIIGGVFPLGVTVLLAMYLPESVKFLLERPERHAELLAVVRRMRRDLTLDDATTFAPPRSRTAVGVHGFRQVFAGDLRWITPLLWVCFATTLMANFFLNSWMPILFERTGLNPEDAAFATGLYHVGGTIGGLMISVLIDRCGVFVVAMFLGMAVPAVAALGMNDWTVQATWLLALVSGVGVLGAQFGNNASAALIYPSEIRARAVGLAFAIGRTGAILGPLLGGYVLARNYPMEQLFRVAAIPPLVAMIAAILLTLLCYRRYGGLKLGTPVAAATGAD